LLTHRQTNKVWQKHNLLGGGNYTGIIDVFAGLIVTLQNVNVGVESKFRRRSQWRN